MIIALISVSLSACSTEPVQRGSEPGADAPTVVRVALGDTLRLHAGEVGEVADEGLRILFEHVTIDSRCPIGVTCVWEGDAAAVLSITLGRENGVSAELHTHVEPRQLHHRDYTVTLLDVEPYPREGVPTRADEYVAVLRITRH